jgi:hypothetical protein
MKFLNIIFAIIIGILLIIITTLTLSKQDTSNSQKSDKSTIHSQYAGQETRGIKALSQDDIDGLLSGAGTPFGGMAKPAELNGYPGPRHVLDAIETSELEVSDEQKNKISNLYEEMKQEAIDLGKLIIDIENEIDKAFVNKTITEEFLERGVAESADAYSKLRVVHLKYHLYMVDILTPEQVTQYNDLRGYTSENPCKNTPEGHDPAMWKLHNNCE